jgi:hypothetical protein
MQIVEASPTASTLAAARRARLERFAEASRQFEAKKRTDQERAEQEEKRAEWLAAIEAAIARAEPVDDAPHFVVRMPPRWLAGMSMTVRKCVSAMVREFGVTGKGYRRATGASSALDDPAALRDRRRARNHGDVASWQ